MPAARNIPMIGLCADELPWVRQLVWLLRHTDPTVPELTRQALQYLSRAAEKTVPPRYAGAPGPQTPPC